MVTASASAFHKEKIAAFPALILFAAILLFVTHPMGDSRVLLFGGVEPIRPLGIHSSAVRSGLAERLRLAEAAPRPSGQRLLPAATLEAPVRMGSLQPKGRVNPDGSEVWGYPEGSGLEDVIEVHVKNGRVVREVLRPSSRSSAHTVAGRLSK